MFDSHWSLKQLVEPELLHPELPVLLLQLRVKVVHCCHLVPMAGQHSLHIVQYRIVFLGTSRLPSIPESRLRHHTRPP